MFIQTTLLIKKQEEIHYVKKSLSKLIFIQLSESFPQGAVSATLSIHYSYTSISQKNFHAISTAATRHKSGSSQNKQKITSVIRTQKKIACLQGGAGRTVFVQIAKVVGLVKKKKKM